MWARKRIDLAWKDLLFALAACIWPHRRAALTADVQRAWTEAADALCFLSVRSGFDVLWDVLKLPPGSEVLMSAVTIPHMEQIVRAHGLVPVPVDISLVNLEVDLESVAQEVTPRTRAIVVAHLFGSRMPLDALARFARRRNLMLIEDAAQAFQADAYRGHPDADVAMFSFGPIKTATALGGAMLRVRDPRLRAAMQARAASFSCQSRAEYALRVLKYCGVKLLALRLALSVFVCFCHTLGVNYDAILSRLARGFAPGELQQKIRRQPSLPLLALMRRRLGQSLTPAIDLRRQRGEYVAGLLEEAYVPGRLAANASYWVLPILVPQRNELARKLASAGYDVSRGQSLALVQARDRRPPPSAQELLADLLFLPDAAPMSPSAVVEMVRLVESHVRCCALENSSQEPFPRAPDVPSSVAERWVSD